MLFSLSITSASSPRTSRGATRSVGDCAPSLAVGVAISGSMRFCSTKTGCDGSPDRSIIYPRVYSSNRRTCLASSLASSVATSPWLARANLSPSAPSSAYPTTCANRGRF